MKRKLFAILLSLFFVGSLGIHTYIGYQASNHNNSDWVKVERIIQNFAQNQQQFELNESKRLQDIGRINHSFLSNAALSIIKGDFFIHHTSLTLEVITSFKSKIPIYILIECFRN